MKRKIKGKKKKKKRKRRKRDLFCFHLLKIFSLKNFHFPAFGWPLEIKINLIILISQKEKKNKKGKNWMKLRKN